MQAAGTYILGSINIDMSRSTGIVDNPTIFAFLRSGIDGVTDKKGKVAPLQLNDATLFVGPEPGSAGLLGLGIFGLACFGRKRKSQATPHRAARVAAPRYTARA